MRDLIERVADRLDDPIIMEWALNRYEHAELRGPDYCRPLEEAWFHEATLRRWVDCGDHDVLSDLFRLLPTRLFASLRPEIVRRWSTWSGVLASQAMGVLLEGSPEEVLPLLTRHIENWLGDFQKTLAVSRAFADLPGENVRQLLDDLTCRALELPGMNSTHRRRVMV